MKKIDEMTMAELSSFLCKVAVPAENIFTDGAVNEAFDEVAKLLNQGMIYNDILEQTGASSATISRVNRSLNYGTDAYRTIFIPHGWQINTDKFN